MVNRIRDNAPRQDPGKGPHRITYITHDEGGRNIVELTGADASFAYGAEVAAIALRELKKSSLSKIISSPQNIECIYEVDKVNWGGMKPLTVNNPDFGKPDLTRLRTAFSGSSSSEEGRKEVFIGFHYNGEREVDSFFISVNKEGLENKIKLYMVKPEAFVGSTMTPSILSTMASVDERLKGSSPDGMGLKNIQEINEMFSKHARRN